MNKLGILGGGISGLSTAFYILRQNPKANILLFEGSKIGGWIQTVSDKDFQCEAGPRSFRISEKVLPMLSMSEVVGLSSKVVTSKTKVTDSRIFTGEKLSEIIPSGNYKILKMLFFFPQYRRFILNNYVFKNKFEVKPGVEDLSIRELMELVFRFSSEEEKSYFIDVMADAFIQGVYSGDISQLSGRFCFPFSVVYEKNILKVFPGDKKYPGEKISSWVRDTMISAVKEKANAMNYVDGMYSLPDALINYLKDYPGFTFIPEAVEKLSYSEESVSVKTSSSVYKLDHIVSTIPSHQLSPLVDQSCPELSKLCQRVPHNSLKTVSVGFEKLDLKGVGFLIPTKYQTGLNGVLYDSCSFSHLTPSISLMGSINTSTEKMLEIFRKITGCQEKETWVKESVCLDGLPQYLKGHLGLVDLVEKASPSWLTVSGQSFYLSGVPNCIMRAKNLVNGNTKFI